MFVCHALPLLAFGLYRIVPWCAVGDVYPAQRLEGFDPTAFGLVEDFCWLVAGDVSVSTEGTTSRQLLPRSDLSESAVICDGFCSTSVT